MRYILIFFSLLLSGILRAQPTTKTMLRLPDTGEKTSYTNTFGEDHDFTINPPFFIKNGNGTVTDTVTGLMWQQTDGGEMTIEKATLYCDTLTLGGFTDWRLPSAHEAFSILNQGVTNPALDVNIFTKTAAEYWWSSDFQANDNTRVWVTNSGGGIGNHLKTETISAGGTKKIHVRAVRNPLKSISIANHFYITPNNAIYDSITQLYWTPLAFTDTLSWEESLAYADTLNAYGYSDWRLPNIKELQSINDEKRIAPSVNITFFTKIGTRKYWSSTSLPNQTTKAWYLYTQYGITTYDPKIRKNYVLCVRGGMPISANNIAFPKNPLDIQLFPNPASEFCTLQFSILKGNAQISVMDIGGKTHFSQLVNMDFGKLNIDLQIFKSGLYKIIILSPKGVYSLPLSIIR